MRGILPLKLEHGFPAPVRHQTASLFWWVIGFPILVGHRWSGGGVQGRSFSVPLLDHDRAIMSRHLVAE